MNITLTSEIQKFVEEKLRAGQYRSADEAVNGLLASLREQETLSPADVEELRAEIDVGLNDAKHGRFVEFAAEDIIAEGRAALARRKAR